jgi:membrane protein
MKFEFGSFFKRLYAKAMDDDVLGNAAQVAFYFTFALFPLLLFLMSLLGLILSNKENLQNELFVILGQVMPASASDLVQKTLTDVTSSASGGKLSIGILITLWSAAAGVDNMRGTLNGVYDLKETRSFIRTKLTSLILTVCIGALILMALAFIVYGSEFLGSVLPIGSLYVLEILEWIVVLILVLLAFALLYNFAPNHDPMQYKWLTPGAIVGVLLWVAVSGAFKLYLHYFDSYAATYGSLGAMIILLFWLYLTALVILMGGAINAVLDEKTGVKKDAEDKDQERKEEIDSGDDGKG